MNIISKNKYIVIILLIILAMTIFQFRTYILSMILFVYNRVIYSDYISFSSISFRLPDKWWIQDIKDDERIIIARMPKGINNRILLLAIINESYNPVCSDKYGNKNLKYNNKEFYPIKLMIPVRDNTLFDVYWIYPSLSICIMGVKYRKDEIVFTEDLINHINNSIFKKIGR